MKQALRVVVLFAAGLAVSACATLTSLAYSNAAMAYSNLTPMIAWYVDEYVEMSHGQKDWVRERLEKVMNWHRSHELPEYRRFLDRVLAESVEPFTVDEVGQAYADLRKHYRRTVEQVLPDIADFLMQLDAGQVAQMERKFADDNRKFVRESVKGTPEERLQRRARRFIGHMEGWLGSVDEAQRTRIRTHYRAIPDLVEERLAERKVRHAETLALIRGKPSKEKMIAGLRRLLLETDSWRRPEYVKKLQERDQRAWQMLSELSASLSVEQRAHLQRRIRGYMRDITTLTAAN